MPTAKTAPRRAKAPAQPAKNTRARNTPAKKAPPKRTPAKAVPKAVPKATNGAAAKPPAPAHVEVAKPKHKLVRDSFTIPKAEYLVLDVLKLRAAKLGRPVKKSELIRAGIAALNAMTDKSFVATLETVPSIKTGRPKAAVGTKTEPAA
jgi:hypothetical protein